MGAYPKPGLPVPRELLDPKMTVKPQTVGKLLERYLKGLDYKKNPCLRSPAEMRKAGFKGKPYTLAGI